LVWRQISAAGAILTALCANAPGCDAGRPGYGWRQVAEDVAGAGLVIALFPLLLGRRWTDRPPAMRSGERPPRNQASERAE
jgi:hypothetical protein